MKRELPETKRCKYCQTEIPYGAKVCPNCQRKLKGGKAKWIVIAIAFIAVIGALIIGALFGVGYMRTRKQ